MERESITFAVSSMNDTDHAKASFKLEWYAKKQKRKDIYHSLLLNAYAF